MTSKRNAIGLNKQEADAIFDDAAILFDEVEGVPEAVAVQILGKDAVSYATKPALCGRAWNIWGGVTYLYRAGIYLAVTYQNVMACQLAAMDAEKGAAGNE